MKRTFVVGLSVATLLLPLLAITVFGAAGPQIYVPMGQTGHSRSYPGPQPTSGPRPTAIATPRPSSTPRPSATATPRPPATPVPATPVPATPVPPAPTVVPALGKCGESMDAWHPPVVNGCAAGHEHGDQPPSWITDAGYQVRFTFHGNTSPAENTAKHAAMKGFLTRMDNEDIYLRIHAASNPLDRMARYHSYELWIRDASGAVSHIQGWYNSGDPRPASEGGSRYIRRRGVEPNERPIILALDETSLQQGINCEQWYAAPGQPLWGPDFGWTICNATTLYRANENATAADQSSWVTNPGETGTTRRLEIAWYANRSPQRGRFISDQFGDHINSCVEGSDVVKFGTTYKAVCLEQYLAPTLQTIQFPDNAVQKVFPDNGVVIPN